jgi:hypothetical protein
MGHLLVDSSTKGFVELSELALDQIKSDPSVDKTQISPALSALLTALSDNAMHNGPTEVVIMINGDQSKAFSFVIDDLSEIQEILQWTVGRE